MIRQTRLKFFVVMSAVVVLMIALLCGTILVSTKVRDNSEARNSLERTISIFGSAPEEGSGPIILQIRDFRDLLSFVVMLDFDNNIIKQPNATYYTEQEVNDYVARILNNDIPKHFLVIQKNLTDGKLIAWVDRSFEAENFNSLVLIVLLIGCVGILMMLIGAWFLSFWIVRPTISSLEKQKRFISEASHEMKTPLTIISAGVELMEEQTANTADTKKWLNDIKTQTEKMATMASNLLALSRLEEEPQIIKTEFDLSQEVLKTALTFESIAYEQRKDLIFDIDENIKYKGNSNAVAQVLTILCDNALKHSDKKAVVKVSLKNRMWETILSVINTGGHISETEIPLLFERFYRGSESRTETQGAGLGLAILKTLAEQNGWKIGVQVNSDQTVFSLTFENFR